MTLEIVAAGAARIGIQVTPAQLAQLARYVELLLARNQQLNLTRIVDPEEIERRHLLDSLTCALPVLESLRGGAVWRCIDVGSGGGLPGLPLAIIFPTLQMTLLESAGKKAAFLREAATALGLETVSVIVARAEDAARDADTRDSFDLAVARALAPLDVALELCLPFVKPGGLLILPRGSDLEAQLPFGQGAADELAARLRDPISLDDPELPPGRSLVVAEKLGPTPARFPRRAGMAAKRRARSQTRSQETRVRRQESGDSRGTRGQLLSGTAGEARLGPGCGSRVCTDGHLPPQRRGLMEFDETVG